MKLIIIGPMASGKSVVGKKLSKRMGLDFFDTDDCIEKKAGVSVSWIFDVEGEDSFRKRESTVFSELIELDDCVISTGGGIIKRKENRDVLKEHKTVYLEVSIQTQLERTLNDEKRPLINNKDNKEEVLRELARQRVPLYEECSFITISEKSDPNLAVDEILKNLKTQENGNN